MNGMNMDKALKGEDVPAVGFSDHPSLSVFIGGSMAFVRLPFFVLAES